MQQQYYDVLLTDVKMPKMDSLQLLKKSQTLAPHTLVILITGHGDRHLAVQALESNAYWFVEKPFDRDFFSALLGRALREATLRHEALAANRKAEALAAKLTSVLRDGFEDAKHLHAAAQAAGAGFYRWDANNGTMYWSREFYALMGLDPYNTEASMEAWLHRVHSDDRIDVKSLVFDQPHRTAAFQINYRAICGPNKVRQILLSGARSVEPPISTGLAIAIEGFLSHR